MEQCPRCTEYFSSLQGHYRYFPDHAPKDHEPRPLPTQEAASSTGNAYAEALMIAQLEATIAAQILSMHSDKYMTNAQVETAVSCMCTIVEGSLAAIQFSLTREASFALPCITPLVESIRHTLTDWRDSSHAVKKAMKTQRGHITPIERPLGSGSLSERIDTKGELAVFSLTAVLSRVRPRRRRACRSAPAAARLPQRACRSACRSAPAAARLPLRAMSSDGCDGTPPPCAAVRARRVRARRQPRGARAISTSTASSATSCKTTCSRWSHSLQWSSRTTSRRSIFVKRS